MRVLFINSFFSVGGPPRIVRGIYDVLSEKGHECALAAGREKPLEYMNTVPIGGKINKYLHAVDSYIFDRQGFGSKGPTKRLIKFIESYKPNIIHLHNLHGYYINIEVLFDYLKKAGLPVVVTLHDCWMMTGHCAHFDFVGCERWKSGCFDCPEKGAYPRSFGFDNSKSNYVRKKAAFTGVGNLTIVGVSNWLAQLAKESFLGEYPVRAIHNGIDLEKFKVTPGNFREKYGLEDKKIILGVAQNWMERKGVEDFARLAELLDDSYKIVMVGVTQEVRELLPESILALERTENIEQLCEIYTAADVFLNMTKNDSFPTVNLEALACGTPVVTYRTGGSPEAIDDTCGVITEERTPGSALAAIKKAENLNSENCIARARQFDMNDKYNEYVKLYEVIIQNNV